LFLAAAVNFQKKLTLIEKKLQAIFQMLGAAFAISASSVPEWNDALSKSSGNFIEVILSRAGGFGKFCTVRSFLPRLDQ
jgi:hypothetical protein